MQNRAKNPLNICLLLVFNPPKNNHFPANTSGGAEGSWECSWQLLAGDAQDTEVLLHQNAAEWVKEKQNPSTSSTVLKESLKAELRAQLVKKKFHKNWMLNWFPTHVCAANNHLGRSKIIPNVVCCVIVQTDRQHDFNPKKENYSWFSSPSHIALCMHRHVDTLIYTGTDNSRGK